MQNLIKGGGFGGEGEARTPVEAPNTLKSVQYARVLDLVSEGEIEGLVDGLKSVYIDNTPLIGSNNKYNFSNTSVAYRYGTQSQSYIKGFPSVENEVNVSTEVKYGTPVVRSITNTNITSVRVTVSVPSLTKQNTENGDITGASVSLSLEYQNNGGGWIPARISREDVNLSRSLTTATSGTNNILGADIGISWEGNNYSDDLQVCKWKVEYRQLPSGSWTTLKTGSFTGTRVYSVNEIGDGVGSTYYTPPKASASITFSGIEAAYEFRVTKLSGTGSLSISRAIGEKYSSKITITGKTVSKYQKSVVLDLPDGGPWDIRISRVTKDSTSSSLQNKTYFDSFTEIIDAKLSYPNSAIFGISIDARQFSSIPSRAFEIYGIKVKIPDNYDPIERTYTGEWSGDFVTAWTDNPAWIMYDIVTNNRYGLGDFIDASIMDKWALYSIAMYCDELVPSGYGGMEPRFTCNAYIQTRYEAYNLISQIASVFRSMVLWSSGVITFNQDRPSDVVAVFSNSNVVNGDFSYSGSSAKTRHTVCLVTWNDPKDRYRQKVEYVEDREGIARYGVVQTEITAFGCTSQGQAHRMGRWLLYSERLETETVTFKAGLESALIYPGAIIRTQDRNRSGKRHGGRLFGATTDTIILDSEISIESGKSYELSLMLPDGNVESREIVLAAGNYTVIPMSPALPAAPVDGAVWILAVSDLSTEEWRVVSIKESEPGVAEVIALMSRQDKYAAVENGLELEPIIVTTSTDLTVTNLQVTEALYLETSSIVGTSVIVSWTGNASSYVLSYYSEDMNPVYVTTLETSYTFKGIREGVYEFTVQPVSVLGVKGDVYSLTKEVFGLIAPPADVSNLNIVANQGQAYITFNPASDLDVIVGGYLKLRYSKTSNLWNNCIDLGAWASGNLNSVIVPLLEGYYLAKWVDSSGNESENATYIYTEASSIINLNVVATAQEEPLFAGTRVDVGISEFAGQPCLSLESSGTIDDIALNIDSVGSFDSWGGVSSFGEYFFDNEIDLGEIYTSKLTANIEAFGINYSNIVDLWGDIDSLSSIDGDLLTSVETRLYIKYSNDNITYTDWAPFLIGDYTARYFKFKVDLTNSSNNNNIAITKCSVAVDLPDTIYSGEDISSGTGIYSVIYPKKFYGSHVIGITAQNMQTGDYYTISNKTLNGFDIEFKNSSGTTINRVFDYISKGY